MKFVHGVIFCKSARGGFAVAVQKVAPRVVHRFYYQIKAYLARISQKVGKAERVDCPHRRNGVALYAGYLHESRDWVAGQTEVVFHGNLRGVFNLS